MSSVPRGFWLLGVIVMVGILAVLAFTRRAKLPQPIQPTVASSAALPILGQAPLFRLAEAKGKSFGSRELRDRVWLATILPSKAASNAQILSKNLCNLQAAIQKRADSGEIRMMIITDSSHPDLGSFRSLVESGSDQGFPCKILVGSAAEIDALGRATTMVTDFPRKPGSILPEEADGVTILVDFYGRVRKSYHSPHELSGAEIQSDLNSLFAERLPMPTEVVTTPWLEPRRLEQLLSAKTISAFHNFQFKDRVIESGITFRNKIVDDAGRLYEAAHYDHGNGIVVADVDGDEKTDIYFLTQAGPNELWRNLGEGKFENITASAGVALPDRISVSAAFGDIDNDGDADLFVTTVRHGNVLFENLGGGKFRDVTSTAGVGYLGHSSAPIFFDYNRDGLLDLFVTNVGKYTQDEVRTVTREPLRGEPEGSVSKYYRAFSDAFAGHLRPAERNERSVLYRNDGQLKFTDVTEATQLVDVCWSGDASPCDFNQDGWPDLYVLNMQGHDEYYENQAGQTFRRRSQEIFPNTPWGSMGIKIFDFDNDGQFDLFLTDMHSDMSEEVGPEREKLKSRMMWPPRLVEAGEFNPQPGRQSIYGNAFFRNLGQGKFEEVSDRIGAETYWPWGLSVGDVNADGFDDAFITASMNYPFRYAINSLLLNEQGQRFRDSEFIVGIEPRRDGRTATPWFALDCNGTEQGHKLCSEPGVTGPRMVWSAVGSKSSVVFDLDNDGDLDIVTNEVNEEPMVLISNLSVAKPGLKYLQIRLKGSKSNRDGLGAIVTVRVGSQKFCKVHDGLSGYMSHSLAPLYFGLDKADHVEAIEVEWPSGTKQVVAGPVKSNQTLEIVEQP
jgi:hypothetical protein